MILFNIFNVGYKIIGQSSCYMCVGEPSNKYLSQGIKLESDNFELLCFKHCP